MNILLAGKIHAISDKFVQKLRKSNKCVAFQDEQDTKYNFKKITTYVKQNNYDNLSNIFQTYDFDYVIFFAQSIDGTVSIFDELEKLERFLFVAKTYRVKNFIYITSNDLQGEITEDIKETSRYIMMRACEKLCYSTAQQSDVKMMVLRIPYIYSTDEAENHIQRWMKELIRNRKVTINASAEIVTDFLCDEDLAELCTRIVDEPLDDDYKEMNLSGGNNVSFSQIQNQIKNTFPRATIEYTYQTLCMPKCIDDGKARLEYGWIPMHVMKDDFESILKTAQNTVNHKAAAMKRVARNEKLQRFLRISVELIVLFVVSLLLNRYLSNNVLLNFVDFLMIYVVIMGSMNGQNAGVAAGLLASAGYLFGSLQTTQWQILFYNVQNWLPFAIYFLLGSMSGYIRDKHDDEVRYMREEYQILEQKYIFLNELYMKVLESKDQFNSQIIGYKDSFGKLYGIVKKLDSTLQEEINFEAITILEDMLENRTVAIYSINRYGGFGRLEVCSKNINDRAAKSIRLDDYKDMMKVLNQNQLYINTECNQNNPSYAAPIFKGDRLIAMIFLMEATERQMQMEFSNKFMIICNLVEDALTRSIEYNNMEKDMLPGTRILKFEKFKEILEVKKDMRAQEYLDFTLIHVHKKEMGYEELSKMLEKLVRNTDVIGMEEDGEVYLILNQTSDESVQIIEKRLQEKELEYEIVDL